MSTKITSWLANTKKLFMKIKLVDRCLIVFMMVLMLQSSYNLFVNECASQETSMIDVVVRTTSAAIFGYFLSANFIKRTEQKNEDTTAPLSTTAYDTPQNESDIIKPRNQIGFAPQPTNAAELTTQNAKNTPNKQLESETSHQQIIIATSIGLFALITIIVARNFLVLTPAVSGTISQMRDFVSGCVGFLLGSPGVDNHKA